MNLDEQGKVNCASKTKEILYSAGFGFVWVEKWVSNEREFLNIFKQRLKGMFRQNETAKLRGSDCYKVYRTIKFYFVSENGWSCIRIRKFRDAIVQFWLGVSEMWTHKYGYCRDVSEETDMNCPFCIVELDDECHFLFRCQKYDVLRPSNLEMLNVDVHLMFCVDYPVMKVVVLVVVSS